MNPTVASEAPDRRAEVLPSSLDAAAVQKLLPHRYPALMVDRMEQVEWGVRGVGIKAVTGNEPHFQGHFPGLPIMPGVLIVEAIAQTVGLIVLGLPQHRGRTGLLTGIQGARFRRPVVPGDVLRIEVEISRLRSNIGKGSGVARVNGEVVAEAAVSFAVGPPAGQPFWRPG
jgi:3-hydroxyacyl-[acyl-carrier-protein] dehydratase